MLFFHNEVCVQLLRITAVSLAFLALVILGYDYCEGHYDSSTFDMEFCPLCKSYMSTEITPVFSLHSVESVQCILFSNYYYFNGSYHSNPMTHKVARRDPPYMLYFIHLY